MFFNVRETNIGSRIGGKTALPVILLLKINIKIIVLLLDGNNRSNYGNS